MNGIIFNIQRFCVNDGPGIRTTVFLKGCPLSCAWCHNPESQKKERQIMFYAEKCVGCGECRNLTPDCTDFICINGAKEICGREIGTDEVIAEVLKDKSFYDNSGGGITLSGGEPLYQLEFSLSILEKAKQNGIHTAVETCGICSPSQMTELAVNTDLFLLDYKETDLALHRKFTGADNGPITENLKLLQGLGKSVVLRCPLIPGFNDREEHFRGIADTANRFSCIEHVEIEPYHSLGLGKYEALGRESVKIPLPEAEQIEKWLKKISSMTEKTVKRA